ncbi:MAG: hypothetical protein ACFFE2_03475 [Candidatus Thorarchaeota archaeon]
MSIDSENTTFSFALKYDGDEALFLMIVPILRIGDYMGDKKQIGVITRYFHKIGVAAIMLEDSLSVGNKISIEGATTNFEMTIKSMQVDRADIETGSKGQEIAIKVPDRVREKDIVYLIN